MGLVRPEGEAALVVDDQCNLALHDPRALQRHRDVLPETVEGHPLLRDAELLEVSSCVKYQLNFPSEPPRFNPGNARPLRSAFACFT